MRIHVAIQGRNMDAHVNVIDDPFTTDKNLVNLGPVAPDFLRARRRALPRISSGCTHPYETLTQSRSCPFSRDDKRFSDLRY